MVLFRIIIFVSLTSSVCGVLLGRGVSQFSRFDHVLVDVDGTLNAHHPEQNPTPEYYPKQPDPEPQEMAAYSDCGEGHKWKSWCETGQKDMCGLEHFRTDKYHFGDDLWQENYNFVATELLTHPGLQYFLAVQDAPSWGIDEYTRSLNKIGFALGPGRPPVVSATSCTDGGGGYVAKANTIRKIAGCGVATGVKKEKAGEDGSNKPVNRYKTDDAVIPACDLSRVLVIDDCPFTMAAYRVHLPKLLPGMATLFVAPHFSIFNDADLVKFLETPGEGKWGATVKRPVNPYRQYSKDKPAMGIDVPVSEWNNPDVGQSVYWVNK